MLLPCENVNLQRRDPKKPDMRKITIYVISRGTMSKVGISTNTKNRLENLRAGAPEQQLKIEFSAAGPAHLIRRVEKAAHAALVAHLVGNEWFAIEPARAIEAVRAELAKVGLS